MNRVVERLFKGCRMPVMPIMTHPGIDLIGRTVADAVSDGRVHADAIVALRGKYPQNAASTTIMDLSVEAQAFGAEIVFEEGSVPTVTGRLLTCGADVETLEIPSLEQGRLPEYLKAIRLAVPRLDCDLLGGCIGPFSLAGRLYDMTELMMAMYIEPDTAHLLLQKCTDFILSYVKAIKEAGASGVIMAEPASGLLSNDDCAQFSSAYVRQIVSAVQDDTFAVVLHNCGNQGQCTEAMVASGAAALHFGNAIDMAGVLSSVPRDIAVMGNVDPVGVMKFGTPQQVAESVLALKQLSAGHDNYVLSTGCDVPPATPEANIDAFYESANI
ncbi:MAG: uroporphyrinogen decarboxylase family protein [Bacteroidaceae bacterium]|nr:uroporphyrinogen decarboxylase family protein [Bacteroidaceae bacterium]